MGREGRALPACCASSSSNMSRMMMAPSGAVGPAIGLRACAAEEFAAVAGDLTAASAAAAAVKDAAASMAEPAEVLVLGRVLATPL
jgi:hypothetical protein